MADPNETDVLLTPTRVVAFPKTVELEQRIARTELLIEQLQATIDVLNRRIVSLQAQLDITLSRFNPY